MGTKKLANLFRHPGEKPLAGQRKNRKNPAKPGKNPQILAIANNQKII
jgi:hypothetical protein